MMTRFCSTHVALATSLTRLIRPKWLQWMKSPGGQSTTLWQNAKTLTTNFDSHNPRGFTASAPKSEEINWRKAFWGRGSWSASEGQHKEFTLWLHCATMKSPKGQTQRSSLKSLKQLYFTFLLGILQLLRAFIPWLLMIQYQCFVLVLLSSWWHPIPEFSVAPVCMGQP